jgi:hypothetical protein
MKCAQCGSRMNHHADKLVSDGFDSLGEHCKPIIEAYSCPHCGFNAVRESTSQAAGLE